jgi:hypothetical protein
MLGVASAALHKTGFCVLLCVAVTLGTDSPGIHDLEGHSQKDTRADVSPAHGWSVQDFFFTVEEESGLRLPPSRAVREGVRVPGYAQPRNISGDVLFGASPLDFDATTALCFFWEHTPGHIDPSDCFYDYSPRYSWMEYVDSATMYTKTCEDVYSATLENRSVLPPFCKPFFDAPLPVLLLEGPTLILSRTPHLPHFLEEISAALTWLAQNDEPLFAHVMVDQVFGMCLSFDRYFTGLWVPNGSPLCETLQVQLLQTVAKGIVFSWGIRPERSVCLASPWISPRHCRDESACGGLTQFQVFAKS